jgi:hypothetical protein
MAKKTPPANNSNAIKLDAKHVAVGIANGLTSDMTPSHLIASLTTRSVNTAFTVKKFANVEDNIEVSDYILELQKAGNEVVEGNLGRLERLLTSQAIALDTIFNRLALKAAGAEYMNNYEGFMRLAFKAQAQSRCTVESLAMLKHPRPYISQTNIGQVGHNQVNNAITSSNDGLHLQLQEKKAVGIGAEISETAPNKLLEANHGERLDIGAQAATGRANQRVETVG